MAKKKSTKRAAPTRKCESCGKAYHPRRKDCPKCGAANPKAGQPRKRRRKNVVRKKATGGENTLDAAIRFVEEAGSLAAATAALERIKRIKTL